MSDKENIYFLKYVNLPKLIEMLNYPRYNEWTYKIY